MNHQKVVRISGELDGLRAVSVWSDNCLVETWKKMVGFGWGEKKFLYSKYKSSKTRLKYTHHMIYLIST